MDATSRAVASPNWTWMPGMWVIPAGGVEAGRISDGGLVPRFGRQNIRATSFDRPDFSDPATLGCLIWLVEKVWPDATITTGTEFSVDVGHCAWNFKTETDLVSALVAALEVG